jgi:hypothetical protein
MDIGGVEVGMDTECDYCGMATGRQGGECCDDRCDKCVLMWCWNRMNRIPVVVSDVEQDTERKACAACGEGFVESKVYRPGWWLSDAEEDEDSSDYFDYVMQDHGEYYVGACVANHRPRKVSTLEVGLRCLLARWYAPVCKHDAKARRKLRMQAGERRMLTNLGGGFFLMVMTIPFDKRFP